MYRTWFGTRFALDALRWIAASYSERRTTKEKENRDDVERFPLSTDYARVASNVQRTFNQGKGAKSMSSKAFNPTTEAGDCPMCGVTFAPDAGQAYFLTCRGGLAPANEFGSRLLVDANGQPVLDRFGKQAKERNERNEIVYRNLLTGEVLDIRQVISHYETRSRGRWSKSVPVFKWQESLDGGDTWRDVSSFDHMVHVDCATGRGFPGPAGETDAHRGRRVRGHNHRVD